MAIADSLIQCGQHNKNMAIALFKGTLSKLSILSRGSTSLLIMMRIKTNFYILLHLHRLHHHKFLYRVNPKKTSYPKIKFCHFVQSFKMIYQRMNK